MDFPQYGYEFRNVRSNKLKRQDLSFQIVPIDIIFRPAYMIPHSITGCAWEYKTGVMSDGALNNMKYYNIPYEIAQRDFSFENFVYWKKNTIPTTNPTTNQTYHGQNFNLDSELIPAFLSESEIERVNDFLDNYRGTSWNSETENDSDSDEVDIEFLHESFYETYGFDKFDDDNASDDVKTASESDTD